MDHFLKHNTFGTSFLFEDQCSKLDITNTMLIGKKTDIHFQSLLDNLQDQKTKESEPCEKNEEDKIVKSECPNCQKSFQDLLKHLSRGACKNKVDENVVLELKEKAKKKHKAQNKVCKARSRKNLEMCETFEEREDRLSKKQKVSKNLRESKLKENPKDLRDKERSKKSF